MRVFGIILMFLVCSLLGYAQKSSAKTDSTSTKKNYPYVLPIWGQKVADRDIEMQLPFGLNVNYVYNQMSLELTEFEMSFYGGETLDVINPETLNFTETIGTTNGVNIRADAWILPFMNVYGIYSRNSGSTQVAFQPQIIDEDIPDRENLKEITTLKNPIQVPKVNFDANSFGFGTTLVYGWSDYFVNADGNLTWSSSDLLEETVGFFVGSARIGKRIRFKNNMKLAVYLGAMYRNFLNRENNVGSLGVEALDEAMGQAVDGLINVNNQLSDVNDGLTATNDDLINTWESLPPATPGRDAKLAELYAKEESLNEQRIRIDNRSETLVGAAGRIDNNDAINYKIKKEIINNWSTQLGFNFEISNHWMYRAELGYRDDQKFFMTGLQYRFGF